MDDQLQLDRPLTEFFQEAKAIALTPEERELGHCALETFLMENSVIIAPEVRLQEYMTHGRESSQFTNHFLGDKEKRQLRKSLVTFMQQNPRFVAEQEVDEAAEAFSLFRMFEIAVPRFALGVMLFLGLGAGVSFASQSTVPGDFLYPFKVRVYEPIVSRLATSDKSQATWSARRAQNRLQEAEALAAESKLTQEAAAELGAQFSTHLNAAQKNLDVLNANGKADVALSIQSVIETYLDTHSSAVRNIALEEKADAPVGIAVSAKVRQENDNRSDPPKGPRSAGFSLTEKVQTILSLPAVTSSSSEASSSSSSSAGSSDPSSSKKNEKSSSSVKKKDESSSSAQSAQQSSVQSSAESSAKHEESSSSVLVPALFEDIMEAASSAIAIPGLLE